MSHFIYVSSLDPFSFRVPDLSENSFSRFLLKGTLQPTQSFYEISESHLCGWWGYDDPLEHKPITSDGKCCFFDGIPPYRDFPGRLLTADRQILFDLLKTATTGFSSLIFTKDSAISFVSLPATHAIFYLKTDNFIAITSSIALLSPIYKLKVREKALLWNIGRGHVGDFGSTFNDVSKHIPGHILVTDASNGGRIQITPIQKPTDFVINGISLPDVPELLLNYCNEQANIISGLNASKKILALSGGKDSRAIASLLALSGATENLEFSTRGFLSSPEAMSASLVAQAIRPNARHTITPQYGRASIALGPIIKTLYSRYGDGSLADLNFHSLSPRGSIQFGGHENGLKTPINKLAFDDYFIRKSWWVDGAGLLKEDVRQELLSDYRKSLSLFLESVPEYMYAHVESLYMRNATFISSNLNVSNSGANQYHPFLNSRLFGIMLSVPHEVHESQAILYLITAASSKDLTSIPYCGDKFPDSIEETLAAMKYAHKSDHLASMPFEYLSFLPDGGGFGAYQRRFNMIDLFRPMYKSLVNSSSILRGSINFNRLASLLSVKTESLKPVEVYCLLGLSSSLLTELFGADLLEPSKHRNIESEIRKVVNSSGAPSKTAIGSRSSLSELEESKSSIRALDQALKDSINHIRNTEENQRDHELKAYHLCADSLVLTSRESVTVDVAVSGLDDSESDCHLCYSILSQPIIDKRALCLFVSQLIGGEWLNLSSLPVGSNGRSFAYISLNGNVRTDCSVVLPSVSSLASMLRLELYMWNARSRIVLVNGTSGLRLV